MLLSDKNPVGGEETNKAFQEVPVIVTNMIYMRSCYHNDIIKVKLSQEFGVDRCSFQEADVSSKADWEKLWSRLILIIMMNVDTLIIEIIRDAKGYYFQGVN